MLFGRKTAVEAAPGGAAGAESAPAAAAPAPAAAGGGIAHKQLGQVLIEEGLITTGQLEKALEEQGRTGQFLGQILVKQGAVSQAAVSSCLVKQCKIPHLSLLDYEVSSEVLALIPEEVCRRHHLLPIDKLGRILTVAMVDPLDTEALEIIRRHCGELKIKPILCNWEHYELVSAKLWGGDGKGGERHVTAESLGLGKLPPAAKPTDRTPTPIPPTDTAGARPAPVSAAAPAPAGPAPVAAGVSARELASAMRDVVQEAVRGIPVQAPAAAPDLSGLAEVLRASVQEAVAAAVQAVPQPQQAPAAATDLSGLAEVMRGAVQEAVSAAVRAVPQPQQAGGAMVPAGPGFDAGQFAAVIQDSVGNAMQEAMAVLVTQMKAMAPRREEGGQAEALASAMRESVREAVQAALGAQQAHGDRLAEIAQATLSSVQQTTQLLESSVVGRQGQEDLARGARSHFASVSPFRGGASGTMDNDGKVIEALESTRPAETMVFDTFVPGNVNAFTFRVCQQVAQAPGGEYNPLFLFGHVGLGKTHLISAIGNHVLKSSPSARVGYVSASHFARRLKDAMSAGALEAFRENYAHWDVLILDDIQFLGGRVEAQEEFFHIFNALHQQGRQIIIASDKAPDRLGLLEQRLISRFASGIVAELKAPEWEARMKILTQQAKAAKVAVPEAILSLIAMRVPDDVRKMTGSLRKVLAFAQVAEREITVEMAEDILSHLGAEAAA